MPCDEVDETSALEPAAKLDGPVTREQLYELVWQEPMLRIGERLGVSSSYMARVCTEMRVPRPAPGYWAQVEFGKKPNKPPLLDARPGDVTTWSPGSPLGTNERAAKRLSASRRPGKQAAPRLPAEEVFVPATLVKVHPLLVGVKSHFLKTRESNNGVLRPFKRMMADIQASKEALDVAIAAADSLYRAMKAKGHRVVIAPGGEGLYREAVGLSGAGGRSSYYRSGWSPERPTVVYIGDVPIGLSLFEMTVETEMLYVGSSAYVPVANLTEQQRRRLGGPNHWTTKKDFASGLLCLHAYCPSQMVKWNKRWVEAKQGHFASMVSSIVRELEAAGPELALKLDAARVEAEERSRQWEEESRLRKEAEERALRERRRKEAREELLVAIDAWDQARQIADYFEQVDRAATCLEGEERNTLKERIAKARELVGELAPLDLLRRWKAPEER